MLGLSAPKECTYIDEDVFCQQSRANPNLNFAKGIIYGTVLSGAIWVGIITAVYNSL